MCKHDHTISRRTLMSRGAMTLGGASVMLAPNPFSSLTAMARDAEPHFFLQIVIPDGLDVNYMFDARPLAMTAAGKVANYLNADPEAWTGHNGQSTWATRLVEPLKAYREDFSVLNGVVMAATFDGHDQNMNYLFTGNPFGGDSFVPHLNATNPTPLDYVQTGYIYADLTNTGASMPLYPSAAYSLVNKLRAAVPTQDGSPLFRFMKDRMVANGQGPGRFSKAAAAMGASFGGAPSLSATLRDLHIDAPTQDNLGDSLKIVAEFFKAKVTRSAMISLQPRDQDGQSTSLDMHGQDLASRAEEIIGDIAAQLARVFELLKTTPFDDNRSMMDMTTIAVGSEFSRTMRQPGLSMDMTGTDHNPLSNTLLLGGKGVKGGLVIGESDFRTADETVSGAHQTLDTFGVKIMGRPFDAATMRPVNAKPDVYRVDQYLAAPMVANTIYSLFGIDRSMWWPIERNGPIAQTLSGLIA